MEYKLLEDDGKIELVIENSKGHRVSTFKGKTIRELVGQLAKSQMHANRELARRPKPQKPQTFKGETKWNTNS